MKIKDDIQKWQEEVHKLNTSVKQLEERAEEHTKEIKSLTNTIKGLVKITDEMTEMMLALIRQQIGD